jgi:hypothetical protein
VPETDYGGVKGLKVAQSERERVINLRGALINCFQRQSCQESVKWLTARSRFPGNAEPRRAAKVPFVLEFAVDRFGQIINQPPAQDY